MTREECIIEILKYIEESNAKAKSNNIDAKYELKGIGGDMLELVNGECHFSTMITSHNAGGDYGKFCEWSKESIDSDMKLKVLGDFYDKWEELFGSKSYHPIKDILKQTIRDWGLDENYHTPSEDFDYFYYDYD